MTWYRADGERNAAEVNEGRLVSLHTFSESRTPWEAAPATAVFVTTGASAGIHER